MRINGINGPLWCHLRRRVEYGYAGSIRSVCAIAGRLLGEHVGEAATLDAERPGDAGTLCVS